MRKHSPLSAVAAAAAAASMLGAAGFAAAAPSAQAAENATTTAQIDAQSSASQPAGSIFDTLTSANAGKQTAGAQLSTIRSGAAAAGAAAASTAATAVTHPQPAQSPASAAAAAVTKHAETPSHAKEVQPVQVAKAQVPAKAQVAKAQPAKAQAAKAQPAKPKHAAGPDKPYLIYDSVTPSSIPHGEAAAVYTNGAYSASPSQVGGHKSVLWIDVNGRNPGANVLDVEPGDATPSEAAHWVHARLSANPDSVAILYTMRSQWQAVKESVSHLSDSMQSKVRYWIADPTGTPHVVPGSSATQWYWGAHYDISTANPEFTQ